MNKKGTLQTDCSGLNLINRGKVRDIYDLGDKLLVVATDRISAFDVVMPNPIPDKGKILTRLSEFWLNYLSDIIDNHMVTTNIWDPRFPELHACWDYPDQLVGRSMLVRKAEVFPIEAIVRGYLAGSGWEDYKKTGGVCGIHLPEGLIEAQKLPEPIFTPSTKAEQGFHDENISFEKMAEIVGKDMAEKIRKIIIALYVKAANYAIQRGVIIADTKFELGLINGKLTLVDEVLTPDSSRFWPADRYRPGSSPESFDKQFLRDYLKSSGWKKSDPAPELPEGIMAGTRARYLQVLKQLTGQDLAA